MIKTAVIEDSKAVAGLYLSYLSESEFNVRIFGSSSDEITRLAKEKDVDIIVCPGFPKGQESDEIVSKIKAIPQLKSAVFVLATTLQKDFFSTHFKFDDIDGLLVKPFKKEDLYRSLSEAYYSKMDLTRKKPLALVVDDSRAVQRVISEALVSINFNVKTASDGAEGLEIAMEFLPDLIITDVEMPLMDGFELCRRISMEPSIQNTPVIVVSGNIDDAQFRKGFKSGAIDFLKKPISQADLFSVIESVSFPNLTIPSGTALVATRDKPLGNIVIKILKSLSFHVNRCEDVPELETFLKVAVPNIIILDLSRITAMHEKCYYIRKMIKDRSSVVIAVADEKERALLVKCFKYGADEIITKPFGRDELKARIKNHLKIKKLQEELVQKNRMLESLAYKDKLTGLMNRRFFDETLKKELERCKDSRMPLSLFMMDLDSFKKVNDTYGHDVGDTILREIASVLKDVAVEKSFACRYGGEEFCVIFPELDLISAVKTAEHIRFLCSKICVTENRICTTISGGVSSYPETSSRESLLIDADNLLYKAKQSGKNRIEWK
ncbi:MAG: diguanylate cyclase [Desulfobacteraceae bacterium]